MPSLATCLTAVVLVTSSVLAAPAVPSDSRRSGVLKRAVSQQVFNNLNLYEQFAAAAYCVANNNSPDTKLRCETGNCPLVEADDTKTLLEFQNTHATDTTGYVARDDTRRQLIIGFRGTESIRNWFSNFVFWQTRTDICNDCHAFGGIWNCWVEVRGRVLATVREAASAHPDYSIVVTGHSLGGGIADLCAAQLRNEGHNVALYTYGAPRLGNRAISHYITNQPGGNFRVTHTDDPVPQLPPVVFGYVHISPEYFISTGNEVSVTPKDIDVFEGDYNNGGNTGHWSLDVGAHTWYFNHISGCYNETFEF